MRIIKFMLIGMMLVTVSIGSIGFADDEFSQIDGDTNMSTMDDMGMDQDDGVSNNYCPVGGKVLDKGTPYRMEYEGKTLGFSSPKAMEQFNENPDRYLSNIWDTEES